MIPIQPAQTVSALRTSTGALQEQAQFTALAETSAYQVGTITCPHMGTKQIMTITVPSTAAMTQADYFSFSNMAGATYAVWLDKDANGTPPSGAVYTAATNKIEVDIVTGGTSAQNATLVKTAIGNPTGTTVVDNLDGTLTLTHSTAGIPTAMAPHSENDGGAGSFTVATATPGVAPSCTQADYFQITNMTGTKFAVWLDKDATTTAPTGAIYVAADEQIEVDITSGQTAAQVAAAIKTAIELNGNWDEFTITDVGAGVLRFTSTKVGVPAVYVRKNANDSGNGSFSAFTITTTGVASNLVNKYINLPGGAHYAWMNHSTDVSSADPAPGGTGIAVTMTQGMTAAQLAAACVTAVDASASFEARDNGGGVFQVTKSATGTATDADAGDSGFSVSVSLQGAAEYYSPSMNPGSISNTPSLIV